MCKYIDMLEARGQKRGEAIGFKRGFKRKLKRGESRLSKLIQLLLKEKQYSEIDAVSRNEKRREELYQLYGI